MGKGNSRKRRMMERERDELNKKIGNMILAEAWMPSVELKKFKADLASIKIGQYVDVIEDEKYLAGVSNVIVKVKDSSKDIAITVFDLLKSSLTDGMLHGYGWDKKFELADIVLPKGCVFN